MNYSEMLDFEINVQVADVTGKHADYCNSWADAGPIIEQHGITLAYDSDGSWVADATAYWVDGIEWQIDGVIHENPLRAAMVAFLMMQEKANA